MEELCLNLIGETDLWSTGRRAAVVAQICCREHSWLLGPAPLLWIHQCSHWGQTPQGALSQWLRTVPSRFLPDTEFLGLTIWVLQFPKFSSMAKTFLEIHFFFFKEYIEISLPYNSVFIYSKVIQLRCCFLVPCPVWLCETPWTEARQAPLSMGSSRQEYWSRLPFPSPGDLPDPGIEPRSPALQAKSLPLSHQGSPTQLYVCVCVYTFPL